MSSDGVSRHSSPAHQQPCRSMAQQGALVRGGGPRLRDQCSGGSLPDSRQRMLNECPANSERGLVSEQEGRSRAKFSMYARISQAGPRPLRALTSGSVRCATPKYCFELAFPAAPLGARQQLRSMEIRDVHWGTLCFHQLKGAHGYFATKLVTIDENLAVFMQMSNNADVERGPNTRRRSSPRSDSLTHLSETSASFRIPSPLSSTLPLLRDLVIYALCGFSVDQQSSMRSSNGNALRSDIRHCSSRELAMPFKPSSLRLGGWDGEHPALIGFSENRPSYLSPPQRRGWCSECSSNRCEPGRSRGWSTIEATHALHQNAAPAVRIDELGAVAYCQTGCRLATHLQITSVCRVIPDQAQLGSLGGLRL